MRLSACVDLLFAGETPDIADRIRMARDAGLDAVEMWRWTDKDLPRIGAALRETGLPLLGLVAEPMVPLTDPARHAEFLEGLDGSIDVAASLGAGLLIVQAGDLLATPREDQRQALVDCLGRAADRLRGTGLTLAVEPLNTRIDHPGYFLPSTGEGLEIVREVGRPEVRLLYDIYHAAVMDEDIEVLEGRLDLVAHVHLADVPGRGEPGSGRLDWQARLLWLHQHGYEGFVGLEYRPSVDTTASLMAVRAAMDSLG